MKKEGLSTLILCVLLSLLLGGAVGHFCFQPQQTIEMQQNNAVTGKIIDLSTTKIKFVLSEYSSDENYQLLVVDEEGNCKFYDVDFENGVGISKAESLNKDKCQFFAISGDDNNKNIVTLELNE